MEIFICLTRIISDSKNESAAAAERLSRLEDALRLSQMEAQSGLARRMELERTLLDLQKGLRDKEVANGQLGDQLRDAQEARLRAEMDREVYYIVAIACN